MAAGYTKRTLAEKLGVSAGTMLVALDAPPTYLAALGPLPQGASVKSRLRPGARLIHQFARRRADLERGIQDVARALAADGMLWISWPKETSGVETDLTEEVVRAIGLPQGLVDVKLCAVDNVWSGLKFVRRVEARARPARTARR